MGFRDVQHLLVWTRLFMNPDYIYQSILTVSTVPCAAQTLSRELSFHLWSATKPQIYPGRSGDAEETKGISTLTEEQGDLRIRNIWKQQTDCILDVRITNLDAPSNIHRKPEAALLTMSLKRRRNTSKHAWTQHRHFSPFVFSSDGVLGNN